MNNDGNKYSELDEKTNRGGCIWSVMEGVRFGRAWKLRFLGYVCNDRYRLGVNNFYTL